MILIKKKLTKERMQSAVVLAILYGLKGADAVFATLTTEANSELLTFDKGMTDKIKGNIKLFPFTF